MSDSPATSAIESIEPAATVPEPAAGAAQAEAKSAEPVTMDIVQIMSILPHRYPFLMIDRVIEMERKTRIVAIKNVSVNEPHFTGHFPDYPIMPGVLTIEAMAQAGGALLLTEIPDREDKLMVFTGIEEARFRRPVVPGDQLRIEVTVLNWRSRAVKMKGVCTVEGKIAADAVITCQLVPRVRKTSAQAGSGAAGSEAAGASGEAAGA
jgi:3-hydroxyacyl-[acyl-carrier-protein] dehydratase